MSNCGQQEEHCCWIKGKPCPYVKRVDRVDRVWTCTLMDEHGDWEAVYTDPRYIIAVSERMPPGFRCKDWPDTRNNFCRICGAGDVPRGDDP